MPVQIRLPKKQFGSVIRVIKKSHVDRAKTIRQLSFDTLKRLGVKRDLSKAVAGMPNGSDQGNVGAIRDWMNKVEKKNRWAVKQVVAIDATAVVRTTT